MGWQTILKSENFRIKTNFPDADFWIRRVHGNAEKVGEVLDNFHEGYIGIKVLATDKILPKYMYYWMMNVYNQGYWRQFAQGTVQQAIRVSDVKDLLSRIVTTEE